MWVDWCVMQNMCVCVCICVCVCTRVFVCVHVYVCVGGWDGAWMCVSCTYVCGVYISIFTRVFLDLKGQVGFFDPVVKWIPVMRKPVRVFRESDLEQTPEKLFSEREKAFWSGLE